eukprot:6176495-Pleurochrysis_carterae.AAC.1
MLDDASQLCTRQWQGAASYLQPYFVRILKCTAAAVSQPAPKATGTVKAEATRQCNAAKLASNILLTTVSHSRVFTSSHEHHLRGATYM